MQSVARIDRRTGLPAIPWDLREEVELWGRDNGVDAKLHFVPGGGWMVRLALRVNDPRMKLYRQGMAAEPPTEDVWFHEKNPLEGRADGRGGRHGAYVPLDILQMGRSGVRAFLDRGSLRSGRGKVRSLPQAAREALDRQKDQAIAARAQAKEQSRTRMGERRRSLLGIPFLRVGIELGKKALGLVAPTSTRDLSAAGTTQEK